MQYEMEIKIVVAESPLRSGWYARAEIPGDMVETVNSTLAGQGSDAITAVQSVFSNLANQSPYPRLIIEAALMRGTRSAKRLTEGDGKGRKR